MFKRKKDKFPKEQVPRAMEEINKAYSELLARAGQAQYLVYVHSNELEQVNKGLLALNQEAANRNALDKQAAAEAAKKDVK